MEEEREEKSEKMTAPVWSRSGLKGQRKLYNSQKDDLENWDVS